MRRFLFSQCGAHFAADVLCERAGRGGLDGLGGDDLADAHIHVRAPPGDVARDALRALDRADHDGDAGLLRDLERARVPRQQLAAFAARALGVDGERAHVRADEIGGGVDGGQGVARVFAVDFNSMSYKTNNLIELSVFFAIVLNPLSKLILYVITHKNIVI